MNFPKDFLCITEKQKYSLCQNFIVLCVEMAQIFEQKREKKIFFNTGPYYGYPPLEIKISKIGLQYVLSWPK